MTASTPPEFLRTIYLGDRACKAIRIESWRSEVVLEVDLLSRVRSDSGNWDFYADEDIKDGRLVFTGVEALEFTPSGPVPNDYINDITAVPAQSGSNVQKWVFEVSIGAVGSDARTTEVAVRITCGDVYIQDPAAPERVIRE